MTAGGEIASSVWSEEGESARELVEKAERRIFAIAEGSARGKGYVSAKQALPALIDQIDDLVQQPQQAARPAHGFHRLRLQDRGSARRRPADHRRPSVHG